MPIVLCSLPLGGHWKRGGPEGISYMGGLRPDYFVLRLLLQLTFWKSLLIGKGVGTGSWLVECTTIVSRDTMSKRPCTFTLLGRKPWLSSILLYFYIIPPRNNIKKPNSHSEFIYWNFIKIQARWNKVQPKSIILFSAFFFSLPRGTDGKKAPGSPLAWKYS